jgi:hypothetical protein
VADYTVELQGRQEGLEYRTATDVYRFDVLRRGGTWELFLPGSKGQAFTAHELSAAEEAEILPRLIDYLRSERRYKWFGPRPTVKVIRRADV